MPAMPFFWRGLTTPSTSVRYIYAPAKSSKHLYNLSMTVVWEQAFPLHTLFTYTPCNPFMPNDRRMTSYDPI